MILFGAQYYRPPTPDAGRWENDFSLMKDAGLNSVQLWAVWGWIEPEPCRYHYDDYDRLLDLAGKHNLKVIISTISDLQPFWMPRKYPGALMMNEQGNPVRGTPRAECLPGITPGCCTDHEDVRRQTAAFMQHLAEHFRNHDALEAWDCWNETRWCVHCENWVCYCPASLAAFRTWLQQRYGTLDALSDAWGRRLASWDDVYPARAAGKVNPALMDHQRWLIDRAADMAAWRYAALREGDPVHFIAAHSGSPLTETRWPGEEAPFARGNDFDNARAVDGYGCSAFPAWSVTDPAEFGVRMEVTRSVAAPKPFWNSELQGGAFNQGFTYGPEVPAGLQQCWTWSAVARGAQGILYWCWRDEVWGVESGGYGIIGQDGHAEDRIRALQQTGALLRRHTRQLEQYTPDPAGVGVVFNSNDVLLAALNRERVSEAASLSTEGTLLALERRRIPFELLDGRALEIPESVRLLILPAAFCLEPESARTILDFMEKGGWVFSEAGTGMFTPGGFYHDRSDERPLTGHLGIRQMYRRGGHLNAHCMIPSDIFGTHPEIELRSAIWTIGLECPSAGHVIARDTANTPVLIRVPHGEGRLVMSGSFPAHAYARNPYSGYEGLLHQLAHAAGAVSSWRITSDTSLTDVFVRTGRAGAQRLFFIINMGDARTFRVFPAEKGARHADEWISGQTLEISGQGGFEVNVPATHHAVLAW